MPTVAEADAYLVKTDRWDGWSDLEEDEKGRLLHMAALKLRSAYPCLSSFSNEAVFLQASYMSGSEYTAAQAGVSSMSASMTGVSISWGRSRTMARADGLDPIVMGLIGDPEIVCPSRKVRRVKIGRAI